MIYFTSDFHFGHTNAIRYCSRPFAFSEEGRDECDAYLVSQFNAVVSPEDCVFVLGDVVFCNGSQTDHYASLVSSLHGHRVLLLGNHDKKPASFYKKCGFLELRTELKFGSFYLCHYSLIEEERRQIYTAAQCYRHYQVSGCTTLIHGHTHHRESPSEEGLHRINVCVDFPPNHYRPVRIDGFPEDLALKYFQKLLRGQAPCEEQG